LRLSRRDRFILFAPLAILLVGWLVGPAFLGLVATLTTYSPFTTSARFIGLASYSTVLHDPQFSAAACNVVVFTVFAVPLELAAGFLIAMLLRRPVPGKAVWRVLLLLPWLISPIASGVMWHLLLGSASGIVHFMLGWLGQSAVSSPVGDLRLALPTVIAIEVWRVAPFVAFLLLPGLESIPDERWDEARLAGASFFSQLVHVAVPGVGGLVLTVGMLLAGLALATFDAILILTGGGPGTATLTPALYSFDAAFSTNQWPVGAAAAWIIAAVVLALGAVYVRLSQRTA